VQGTARDLLAAAIERFEARGVPIVLHVHDEVVGEVAAGSTSESEFLAVLLEPPAWSEGLPLAGTVWSGTHYFEPPDEPPSTPPPTPPLESAVETILTEIDESAQQQDDSGLEDSAAPLWELTSAPLTADHKTTCPFHEGDSTPSLQLYADHFHCFGCGAHGDRHDWLTRVDGMPRQPPPSRRGTDPRRLWKIRPARSHGRSRYGMPVGRSGEPWPSATSPAPARSI
jgi:CHC2 zinc finger